MAISINTNLAAAIAVQNLNRTNKMLNQSQLNVSTGLKINGPKDDASTFAIAQNQRGDIAGFKAIRSALASGESAVNVAIDAGKAISDLLIEMKAKVVQSNQSTLDAASRTALHNDFRALADQIEAIVLTAEFNDVNLINSGAGTFSVLSNVDGSIIQVSAQKMDQTNLAINALSLLTSANAASALAVINTSIVSASEKLAGLGASAKRLEVQSEFVVKLTDVLIDGVGNLVDADMGEESARLQALQVKQQLGIQAISIANAQPSSILGLFRG
ncbi:flagellin [Alphaproteobacteria bacterium]|nr:flagellin [Alphaproteobacteria bacterium]